MVVDLANLYADGIIVSFDAILKNRRLPIHPDNIK